MFGKKNWKKILSSLSQIEDLPVGKELLNLTDGRFYNLKKTIEKGKYSDIDVNTDNPKKMDRSDKYAFKLVSGYRVYFIDQYDHCLNCKKINENTYYYLLKLARERDVYKCIDCGETYYSYKKEINDLINEYPKEDAYKIRQFENIRHLYPTKMSHEEIIEKINYKIKRALNEAEIYYLKH